MASYSDLVRKITTAEVNRVQHGGNFTRWTYFVDEEANKVGVLCANDNSFAAYAVTDTPDPKLIEFGMEPISELQFEADPELLIVTAGENALQARIFTSPAILVDDDFVGTPDTELLLNWQGFLQQHGVQVLSSRRTSGRTIFLVTMAVVIILLVILALFG
jgi:hypothetical protein